MRPTIFLLLSSVCSFAEVYYVSPGGASTNSGSISSPWSISKVCTGTHPSFIHSGDTIILRGGVYPASSCHFTGTAEARITMIVYPGEAATFSGSGQASGDVFTYAGNYADYIGMVATWNGDRREYLGGSNPPLQVPLCFNPNVNAASNLRVINTVSYGCGGGPIPASSGDHASVFYGNIGWDINSDGPDRLHQGWQYDQNNLANGRQLVKQSMSVNIAGWYNFRVYTQGGYVTGITWEENISQGGPHFAVAYSGKDFQDNISRNNFFVGDMTWMSSSYGGKAKNIAIDNDWYVGNVSYYGVDGGSSSGKVSGTFAGTVEGVGWVLTSVETGVPQSNWVRVYANEYEQGRGHIAIYNWENKVSQSVNLSTLLNIGDAYEIMDAWNALSVVQGGTYAGGSVSIPLDGTRLYIPWGNNDARPKACWETSVAQCDATGEYLVFESGANCAELPLGTYTTYQSAKVRGQSWTCYWSGSFWVDGSAITPHVGPNYTRDQRAFAFLVKRKYDGRNDTTLSWRGAITDTVEAGTRGVDGTYHWGRLPVHSIACTDGHCTAKAPQPVGDAYWRIDGGAALRMAAR